MDVINISRSRRFLRERPIRVTLFDRPRLACDLLCLEANQEENRRPTDTSDSLYLIVEGKARIRVGPQIEELEEMDAVLVPPGTEHTIQNTGSGPLTALLMVTPKPTRASEVRMPTEQRPPRLAEARPPRDAGGPATRPARSDSRPPRGAARPAGRRLPARSATDQRDDATEGPAWYPRPKTPWRPRGAAPPAGRGARGRPGAQDAPREDAERGSRRFGAAGGSKASRPPSAGAGRGRPAGAGAGGSRPPAGRPTGRSTKDGGVKKTGEARRASRGQGPLSGRRGPGRSGPRTSRPR